MTDSAEHRVECYRLATDRINRGQPSWAATLNLADIYHNDDLTFEAKRDRIVARIKRLHLYVKAADVVENHPESDGYYDAESIVQVVEELADVETVGDFDAVFSAFYDWADFARVWVKTF